MQKIIGVTDLQRRLKAVLDEVADKHVPYVWRLENLYIVNAGTCASLRPHRGPTGSGSS